VARTRLKLAMGTRSMNSGQRSIAWTASKGRAPRLGAPGAAIRRSLRLSTTAVTPAPTSEAYHVPPPSLSLPPTTCG
jgi:hypothetical protein